MGTTETRCVNCAAYDADGTCHRKAPAAVGGWPKVQTSDWCMEHKQQPGKWSVESIGWPGGKWNDVGSLLSGLEGIPAGLTLQ
mgnify:CR=1 FL=1